MGTGHLFKEHNAVFCFGQPTVVSPAVPLTPAATPASVPVGSAGVPPSRCHRVSENKELLTNLEQYLSEQEEALLSKVTWYLLDGSCQLSVPKFPVPITLPASINNTVVSAVSRSSLKQL